MRRADQDRIWVRLYGDGQTWRKRAKYLEREQCVRISRVKREFEKGYTPNWSSEHYIVTRRCQRRPPPPPAAAAAAGGGMEGGRGAPHPTQPHPQSDTTAARAAECRPYIRYATCEARRCAKAGTQRSCSRSHSLHSIELSAYSEGEARARDRSA